MFLAHGIKAVVISDVGLCKTRRAAALCLLHGHGYEEGKSVMEGEGEGEGRFVRPEALISINGGATEKADWVGMLR